MAVETGMDTGGATGVAPGWQRPLGGRQNGRTTPSRKGVGPQSGQRARPARSARGGRASTRSTWCEGSGSDAEPLRPAAAGRGRKDLVMTRWWDQLDRGRARPDARRSPPPAARLTPAGPAPAQAC